jgi:hypothetical protein
MQLPSLERSDGHVSVDARKAADTKAELQSEHCNVPSRGGKSRVAPTRLAGRNASSRIVDSATVPARDVSPTPHPARLRYGDFGGLFVI